MNQKEMMLLGSAVKRKTHVLTADSQNGSLFGFWTAYTGDTYGSITPTTIEGFSIAGLYTVFAGNPSSKDSTLLFLNGEGDLPNVDRVTRLDMAITLDLKREDEQEAKIATHGTNGILFFDEDKGKTIDLIIVAV